MITLALIADDLTGAADSGAQFLRLGSPPALVLEPGHAPADAQVIILDSESRTDTPSSAYEKVRAITLQLPPAAFLYKKMDSTLRGNAGPEIDAIMDVVSIDRAVVAPAFPPAGRTTVDGRQLLNGKPLEDTPFAQDPLSPVTNSHIPTLLSAQMSRPVGLIPLSVVRSGPSALVRAVLAHPEPVLVLDAVTDEDLRCIAQTVQASSVRLACGSAGLAGALAEVLPGVSGRTVQAACDSRARSHPDDLTSPVLVIAASRNPVTSAQLACAARKDNVMLVEVDTSALSADPTSEALRLRRQAGEQLSAGRSVALTATNTTYLPNLGPTLLRSLGSMAAELVAKYALAGLVLTGGDTALAVCRSLGARTLSLVGEVTPGIPCAILADGPHCGLRLVTKAGGFGHPEAIATAIRHLRHGTQPRSDQASETPEPPDPSSKRRTPR